MSSKNIFFHIVMFVMLLIPVSYSLAEVKVFHFTGSGFVEVADAKGICKNNFIFRDEYKEEAPKYLEPDIVKAAFTGQLQPSLTEVLKAAKSTKKCFWVAESEASLVK